MLLFNVHKENKGFTLIEMVVTVIIVGVLAAVTVPSLVGLFDQMRVKDGLRQIESSLKEAQRQAMRRGSSCTVNFDATNNTITGTPAQCLAGSKIVDDRLEFKGNDGNTIAVIFSHKGNNTSGAKTIAVYRDGLTNGMQKCVILAANLGGIKSGIYTGDVSSDIIQNSCDVSTTN